MVDTEVHGTEVERSFILKQHRMLHTFSPFAGVCVHSKIRFWYLGGGRVSEFPEKNVTKMYGSTLLLALRGGGWVLNLQKKSAK